MSSRDGSSVEEDVYHLYANFVPFNVKDWPGFWYP